MIRSTPESVSSLTLVLLLPLALACGPDDQQTEETAADQQAPAAGQQQAQIEVSDEEMESFVEVQMELVEVRDEVQGQMQAAEDEAQAQELADEANEQMTAIIEDAGMEIDRYDQIAAAIQADTELQQRFLEVREQLLEEEGQ